MKSLANNFFSVSSTPGGGSAPAPPPLFAAGGGGGAPAPPPTGSMVTVGMSVGKVVPSSANSRIVHPEEDVSLEELKAKKYEHLANRTSTVQFSMGISNSNSNTQPQRDNYTVPDAFGEFYKSKKFSNSNSRWRINEPIIGRRASSNERPTSSKGLPWWWFRLEGCIRNP